MNGCIGCLAVLIAVVILFAVPGGRTWLVGGLLLVIVIGLVWGAIRALFRGP